MEYTLASKIAFTEIPKDVEYSFKNSKYNIFVVSLQKTFHCIIQETLKSI